MLQNTLGHSTTVPDTVAFALYILISASYATQAHILSLSANMTYDASFNYDPVYAQQSAPSFMFDSWGNAPLNVGNYAGCQVHCAPLAPLCRPTSPRVRIRLQHTAAPAVSHFVLLSRLRRITVSLGSQTRARQLQTASFRSVQTGWTQRARLPTAPICVSIGTSSRPPLSLCSPVDRGSFQEARERPPPSTF